MNPDDATNLDPEANPEACLAREIAAHPFFAGMSAEHLAVVAGSAMATEFEASQVVFSEGDPANRFYIIQEGKVAIESQRPDHSQVLVQVLGPGEVLGWSWLFAPYRWHFQARALQKTKAIFFYGSRLLAHCEEDRDLGYELMKRMARIVIERLQAARRGFVEKDLAGSEIR